MTDISIGYDMDSYMKVYQEGLVRLRDGLQHWNRVAASRTPPYESDVEFLTQMIDYVDEKLRAGATLFRDVVSLETLRILKAAGMLTLYEKTREITQAQAKGNPERVIRAMQADLAWIQQKVDALGSVEPADVLWAIIPKPEAPSTPVTVDQSQAGWDVFISHAHEDKEPFVRQLAESLQAAGLRVWYDKFTLRVGDRLRRSIDQGLAASRYGVVVLSPYFFAKEWPQIELDGLAGREVMGQKVILPVWHDIDAEGVRRFSPSLADRLAVSSTLGVEAVARELLRVIAGE